LTGSNLFQAGRILRLVPLLMLVLLLAWCTQQRHAQQATMPLHTELVDLFLTQGLIDNTGAPVDLEQVARRAGETSMNRALYDNAATASLPVIMWLVKHGADPQHIGALDKGTLLQRVAQRPTIDRLRYFIDDLHLDPKADTPDGLSLLHVAAWGGVNEQALKYLMSKGLDIHGQDPTGRQPIHYAAFKSIEALVNAGADLNAVDKSGRTVLHAAVEDSHPDVVAELLRRGASVFVADKNGNTPLHLAATRSSDEIVDALLAAGAPRAARNAEGLTPREVFERRRWQNNNTQADRLNKL
jgi:ankyrin repeat protein